MNSNKSIRNMFRRGDEPGSIQVAILQAGWLPQVPIAPDLVAYRFELKPVIDKLIGSKQNIQFIELDRENIFEQAIAFYKKCDHDTHVKLMVTFKTGGVKEDGIDGSGLRREFYHSFFKVCLTKKTMFVGDGRRKFPSNDVNLVQNGYFAAIGRAIVASVMNGDCGFPYLSPIVFKYMVGEDTQEDEQLDAVPDLDIKDLCKHLLDAKTDDEVIEVTGGDQGSIISHIGWPTGENFSLRNRNVLVQMLIHWDIIEKRRRALDQLKAGLNHMGFLEATKKNPNLLPLLVYSESFSLNAEYARNQLQPKIKALECADETQMQAKRWMQEFLNDMSDEDAQSFYQFATGSADPPVADESISMEFNSYDHTLTLPSASTCSSLFRIPLGNRTSIDFKRSMKTALDNARFGFGAERT
ncbi:E3 ubiquitin-protein ligase etc-1-like [Dreissena polymorpha]|uniref:HECT-type E3 ubiquitin transferase n=2 Tax=Dreissena polymorpha TaxID=45954 RepID=A0A9D4ECH7_DREPO|nr:E3 ubiquitin-protein ligase etc-1-like [Dreissena polymorpha]KAH3775622.1 hypothetical protein DPMN_177028 [Dreissena polymorpha]